MRKKLISVFAVGALLFSYSATSLAATVKNTSENEVISNQNLSKTTNEKYSFLLEKRIFKGKSDGKLHFSDKMTRAELASVIYRMYQLEMPKNLSQTFSDVGKNYWARDAIIAVTQAGYMDSQDGKFGPTKSVTLEELATTVAKVMKLDVKRYAPVKLPGSSKAQTYLAAALAENLLQQSDDYTKAALRSDFINTIYAVYEKQFNEGGIVAGTLEPSLTITKLKDGQYEFTFKVKNQTEKEQKVTLSGQQFDYILYKDGKKIKQYSVGRYFIYIIREITLKQGEEYVMKTEMDGLDKGNYKIEFWLADKNWPNARIVKEFTIE